MAYDPNCTAIEFEEWDAPLVFSQCTQHVAFWVCHACGDNLPYAHCNHTCTGSDSECAYESGFEERSDLEDDYGAYALMAMADPRVCYHQIIDTCQNQTASEIAGGEGGGGDGGEGEGDDDMAGEDQDDMADEDPEDMDYESEELEYDGDDEDD